MHCLHVFKVYADQRYEGPAASQSKQSDLACTGNLRANDLSDLPQSMCHCACMSLCQHVGSACISDIALTQRGTKGHCISILM